MHITYSWCPANWHIPQAHTVPVASSPPPPPPTRALHGAAGWGHQDALNFYPSNCFNWKQVLRKWLKSRRDILLQPRVSLKVTILLGREEWRWADNVTPSHVTGPCWYISLKCYQAKHTILWCNWVQPARLVLQQRAQRTFACFSSILAASQMKTHGWLRWADLSVDVKAKCPSQRERRGKTNTCNESLKSAFSAADGRSWKASVVGANQWVSGREWKWRLLDNQDSFTVYLNTQTSLIKDWLLSLEHWRRCEGH